MPLDAESLSPSPVAPISAKADTVPFQIAPPPQDRLRKMFDDARTQSNSNRLLAQRDRDYYDGPRQLDSEVRKVLRMRGQPAIFLNRIQPMIDGILGVLEQSKVDPRCFPRNPTEEDENASDVATKALRYIADTEKLEGTLLDCAENLFIEGIEAVIIEGAKDSVPLTQIRYEEFFFDPYSRRADFKDAKYLGIAKWMDAGAVKAKWPEQYKAMGDPITGGGTSGPNGALDSTWQDRPDNVIPWADRQRGRLMVVEVYYHEMQAPFASPQWFRCVYCGAGVFEIGLSPYTYKNETLCAIEAQSCYIDRDNNRYGRIRNAIPVQDEVNARRSRLLHLANSRQIQQRDPQATPVDATTARKEAARADGVIPPGWQLVQTSDLAAGQQLLLSESKSEIERMGPTPAVLAEDGQNRSGRASLVIQQAGMTELARPLGRHNDFRERIYRACWQRAQQFWTGPMWIRVTDEVKAPEFLQINEPQLGMVVQADPQTGEQSVGVGVVGYKNRISEMDMDIIVSAVPDTANLQQEVFSDIMDLVQKVGLQSVFSKEFAVLIEASPLQNKAEILERLKQAQGGEDEDPRLQQAQQIIQQLTQQVQELMQGKAAAETAEKQASAGLKEAQTEHTQVETQILAFQAGQDSVPEAQERRPDEE